jgi:hypothetical protein
MGRGFRVLGGWGFMVQGLGLRVKGEWARIQSREFRFNGLGLRVKS